MSTTKLRWARIAGITGLVAVVAAAGTSDGQPAAALGMARPAPAADTLRKGPPWCLAGTQPQKSRFILEKIQQFADAADDDSALVDVRVAAGNMPRAAATAVQTVTDEATCRKASRALDQWYWSAAQGAAIHLVKVGTRYAINAPGVNRGEFEEMVHTDARFTKLAIILF